MRKAKPYPKACVDVLINEICLFGVSVRKANAEISAELDGCTSDCAVLLATAWRTKRGGITRGRYFSMECRLSSPRATDSVVEKALYTSGGRNTGADRKDGAILFRVSNVHPL